MLQAYSEDEEQAGLFSQRLNSTERKKAIKAQTFTRVRYRVTRELQQHKAENEGQERSYFTLGLINKA